MYLRDWQGLSIDMPKDKQTYYTYLLRCCDRSLYCGFTNDLARRVACHCAGKGAKYTRSRLPVILVYYETFATKHEAMSREWHIKRLSHAQKEVLVQKKESGHAVD